VDKWCARSQSPTDHCYPNRFLICRGQHLRPCAYPPQWSATSFPPRASPPNTSSLKRVQRHKHAPATGAPLGVPNTHPLQSQVARPQLSPSHQLLIWWISTHAKTNIITGKIPPIHMQAFIPFRHGNKYIGVQEIGHTIGYVGSSH